MWFVPLLLGQSVALPVNTPIPCLICQVEPEAFVFSGTVQVAQAGQLRVFDDKTRQTMGFTVPDGFRGVDSSDGQIKDAGVTRIPPGLLARVTYRTLDGGRRVVTRVLLVTINQCRALQAAERLSDTSTDCPD